MTGPSEQAPNEAGQPLSHAAQALRTAHTAIALFELGCLGYVWACALTGRRNRLLNGAITILVTEGVGLVVGHGQCPLGPLQRRVGDPVPLFELVLPPVWARRAVPILAGTATVGVALALRPVRR
ncbi:MAG: hypothetical protein QOJ63_134 [Solirubrobacteraceae bacterium]|nr:hypothetical protein [Solirubrobacteraceae bacterium]